MTDIELQCPRCSARITGDTLSPNHCTSCNTSYAAIDGIASLVPDADADDVKRFFERVAKQAGTFSASYVPFKDERRDMQLRIFSAAFVRAFRRWIQPSAVVLDVGCGHGALLEDVVSSCDITGVDFAIEMLPAARNRGYRVIHADARALPFADAQFDAVLCAEVVQHFSDVKSILMELSRVCRPGGIVAVSTLNRRSAVRFAGRMLSRVLRPTSLAVPILRRSAEEIVQAAADLPLRVKETAWVCSPTNVVIFTRNAANPMAPLATNFILCFEKSSS